MNASELRIGNWVSWHDDKDDQFQTDSVNETNARLVNPITLTEEWLLKFGFKRLPNWQDTWLWIGWIWYELSLWILALE